MEDLGIDAFDAPPVFAILVHPIQVVVAVALAGRVGAAVRGHRGQALVQGQAVSLGLQQVAGGQPGQRGRVALGHSLGRGQGEAGGFGGEGSQGIERVHIPGMAFLQLLQAQGDDRVQWLHLIAPKTPARQRQPGRGVGQSVQRLLDQNGEGAVLGLVQVATQHHQGQGQAAAGPGQLSQPVRGRCPGPGSQGVQQKQAGVLVQLGHGRVAAGRKSAGDVIVARGQQGDHVAAATQQAGGRVIPGVIDDHQHPALTNGVADDAPPFCRVGLIADVHPQRPRPFRLNAGNVRLRAQTGPEHAICKARQHPPVMGQGHGQCGFAGAGHARGAERGALPGDELIRQRCQQLVPAHQGMSGQRRHIHEQRRLFLGGDNSDVFAIFANDRGDIAPCVDVRQIDACVAPVTGGHAFGASGLLALARISSAAFTRFMLTPPPSLASARMPPPASASSMRTPPRDSGASAGGWFSPSTVNFTGPALMLALNFLRKRSATTRTSRAKITMVMIWVVFISIFGSGAT